MAIDDSLSSRLLTFFRIKPTRLLTRSIFLILVGTLVLSWFVLSQFGPPAFLHDSIPPLPFFGDDELEWGFGKSQPNWPARAARVKQSFIHAYRGYEQYASPMDELLPLSNGSIDK